MSFLRIFASTKSAAVTGFTACVQRAGVVGLVIAVAWLAGCAAQQSAKPRMPEKGDPSYFKARDSVADEVYVNEDSAKAGWIDSVRRIYIAPTRTADVRIVQPPGVEAGEAEAWELTEEGRKRLQESFLIEVTRAMEADQSFHVVATPEEAQAVLHSTLVAIFPYQTRSQAAAGDKVGGAVTMSFALVDPADNTVMIRALDSKSTDNIWAFKQVDNDRGALALIFDAWGHQLRRSLLFLQGRLDGGLQSFQGPVLLKPQQ